LTSGPGVRAVLLDIEGTTTAVSFVTDVLFPFARVRLRESLSAPAAAPDRRALGEERRTEREPAPPWSDRTPEDEISSAVAYAEWLMDRDRKSTALKALQGRIWESGYRAGALCSHLYADVRPALARWRAQGRSVAIFSSGSVLAQRLLFTHTPEGDLTPLIDAWFDTTTGPKREADSYRRIAEALGRPPASILFVSDVAAELDAARAAGLATALCVRDEAQGEGIRPDAHSVVRTLDEVA
jgi:enolase-phosphatase E1